MTPGQDANQPDGFVLNENELRILTSTLNEICNGIDIDDFEFSSRIGADREEVRTLLDRVAWRYDELARQRG